ncbi:MAG: IS1182 family transposase [Candidatus Izemoplasmatales bacterium]
MTNTQLHQEYYNAKQLKLPLDYEVLIPYDSEARTFDEVFRRIDIKKYLVEGSPIGRTGYNPVNMLKLILFCQMEKITSLRGMAKAAQNDIRVMWLADEMKPSHDTIKRFMDEQLKESIEDIFHDINRYLIGAEKIDKDIVYIDGTKIEANANRYQFVWKGSIEKFREKLMKKTTKVIERINQRLELEGVYFRIRDRYQPDDLNKIQAYLESEVERQEIKFVYGKGTRKSAIQREYEDIAVFLEKLTEYEKYLKIIGSDRNSCAKTDHDATFMRMKEDHMRNGQLKAGYNVQIGVADEYILHLDIFQDRSDYRTFIPFLEGYRQAYGEYPKYPVADAGYGGLKNYRYVKSNEMEIVQKYTMYRKDTTEKKYIEDPTRPVNFRKDEEGNYYDGAGEKLTFLWQSNKGHDVYEAPISKKRYDINEELWALQKEARENLESEWGIELRIQRSIQVEGAFGVLKEDFRFRRFRRRGLQNVKFEFLLLAIGYNLSKYHNKKHRVTA